MPVLACTRCDLCQSRKRIVNGRGDEHADIMVIGEGPGREEDLAGKPFVGQSGTLLARLLEDAGIEPRSVYLTNAVRCRPPGNRKPKVSEIRACYPYLLAEIEQVRPKVIITVGATALEAVYKKAKLGDVLGQVLDGPHGIPIVPTYHPAFIVRGKWAMAEIVSTHMAKAAAVAQGRLQVQSLEEARSRARILTTPEQVEALRGLLMADDVAVITTDSETTGLSWLDDEVLGVSFSAVLDGMTPLRAGFYVPFMVADRDKWPLGQNGKPKAPPDWRYGHLRPYWSPEDEARVVAAIGAIFDSGKPIAIQNASFDIRMFERSHAADPDLSPDLHVAFGWRVADHLRYDTYLLQRVINESLPANESFLLNTYADLPYYEAEVREQTQDKHRMDLGDNEVVGVYGALDADGLARILPPLLAQAEADGVLSIHDEISVPMVRACWNMTRRGILVDMPYFARLAERYHQLVASAERAVMEAYGHEWFNLNAYRQIQTALFKVLGLPQSGRKTDGGKGCPTCRQDAPCEEHDATSEAALEDIKTAMRGSGQTPHPILDAIITWKKLSKRKGTYITGGRDGDGGLLRYIRPTTSRVHPEYVSRADTGRLGSYNPAIQTWPKEVVDDVLGEKKALRRCFIAPEGKWWMEADWSQGELWVVAYESGSKPLLELLQSGRDIHSHVARRLCESGISVKFPRAAADAHLSDYEWKNEHGDLRRDAKVMVFGIDYGMTAAGIAERLHCSLAEAEALRRFYSSEIFPGLDDFLEYIRDEMESGYVIRDWRGRLGHFADKDFVTAHSKRGEQEWEESIRKGTNMPIQAGLNDIHMYAHLAVEYDPLFKGRYEIVLAVHDSITGEASASSQDELVKLAWQVKEKMETTCPALVRPNGEPLGWKIPVEVSWGKSWGNLPNVLEAGGHLMLEEGEKE